MICERCGRLLNRATGRCVCADYGGEAPPPVSVTHPPVNAPATTAVAAPPPAIAEASSPAVPARLPVAPMPEREGPITAAAAMAALDLRDRPVRAERRPTPAPVPEAPPAPIRTPGAAVGVVRGARVGRRRTDVVVYDGLLVLASRGAPDSLPSGQLAAQDGDSRILDAASVVDVVVREDALSGKATIRQRNGNEIVVAWPGRKNRGFSAENLLAHAFPGTVDQGPDERVRRTARVMALAGFVILVLVAAWIGLSVLLEGDPPPPPPAAPPVTVAPAEQSARDELNAACPPWQLYAASVGPGDRPVPGEMRPIVDGIRGRFDAAAGVAGVDPAYATARDELAYLQDYARRPPDAVQLESVSRVAFALRTVSAACARAASAP